MRKPCRPSFGMIQAGGAEGPGEGVNGSMASWHTLIAAGTPEPADYWLHPCDCAPSSWANQAPVNAESFESLPAESTSPAQPVTLEHVFVHAHSAFIVTVFNGDVATCSDLDLIRDTCTNCPSWVTIAGRNDFIPSSYAVVKGQSLG